MRHRQAMFVRERRVRVPRRTSIIFFSEPYEAAGMRTHEVYRELLPSLCWVARESGHGLIINLHPFESLSQRRIIVRDVLTPEDCNLVSIVDGPLTTELMGQAWFGITVESTTVIDCLQNNICCFLCGWLAHLRMNTYSSTPALELEKHCKTQSSSWKFQAGWQIFTIGRQ